MKYFLMLFAVCCYFSFAQQPLHKQQLPEKRLPEQQTAVSRDQTVQAFYAQPTQKYTHGILGDAIEAEQLIVKRGNQRYQVTLPNDQVFEDIRPRLADVDNDGGLEFITIRSSQSSGAGIAIYKIVDHKLREFATVPTIGLRNRWLNIAAIADLDGDGTMEITWVQTPHIGGILKVARIEKGVLKPIDEQSFYSNHAIGQRNLCLSVLVDEERGRVLYLPTQNRDAIVGFQWIDDKLKIVDTIHQNVDFSVPLSVQYPFTKIVSEENNCI